MNDEGERGHLSVAAMAASSAMESKAVADAAKGAVKEPSAAEQSKQLRNYRKSTVWLCSDVLGRDGTKDLVTMLMEVIRPIYNQHSLLQGCEENPVRSSSST